MHRHSRPSRLWVHAHDLASLQAVLLTVPLFDPVHDESLYDLRYGRSRRVPCPQRAALVTALADVLRTTVHQHTVQVRQAAALQRQLTRLLERLAVFQATVEPHTGRSRRPHPHARQLRQALTALAALQALDVRTLAPAGPPAPDTPLLLALYTAFVRYGPPRETYPRDAVYTALAVLWHALDLCPAFYEPERRLATLAARLGRRIRRHADPASRPRSR
jgi:hypothetical protein